MSLDPETTRAMIERAKRLGLISGPDDETLFSEKSSTNDHKEKPQHKEKPPHPMKTTNRVIWGDAEIVAVAQEFQSKFPGEEPKQSLLRKAQDTLPPELRKNFFSPNMERAVKRAIEGKSISIRKTGSGLL